jgi:hypothetical protein
MCPKSPIDLGYAAPIKRRRKINVLSFTARLSVAMALIELPWYFASILVGWFILGDPPPTHRQSMTLGTIATMPAAIGIVLGLFSIIALSIRKQIQVLSIIYAAIGLATSATTFYIALWAFLHG